MIEHKYTECVIRFLQPLIETTRTRWRMKNSWFITLQYTRKRGTWHLHKWINLSPAWTWDREQNVCHQISVSIIVSLHFVCGSDHLLAENRRNYISNQVRSDLWPMPLSPQISIIIATICIEIANWNLIRSLYWPAVSHFNRTAPFELEVRRRDLFNNIAIYPQCFAA